MTTPEVLYEDNHLLVVNKPAGMLSQGDKTGDLTIVDWAKQYIKEKYNKPGEVFCGLPHRLDRPVSGVMILARTSKSLERLNKMFREDQVKKTYLALTKNRPDQHSGILRHWLVKDSSTNQSKAFGSEQKGGKFAELTYEMYREQGECVMLKVFPKTGRPHQIRVQLASMNCAIWGDLKYGGYTEKNIPGSIGLHAWKISFIHPVRKDPVEFESQPEHNEYIETFFNGL